MKEAEIRPSEIFNEYLRLSAEDARACFDPAKRRSIPCPACGATGQIPAFRKEGFDYCECRDCRTLFLSPRPPIEEFQAFYARSRSSVYWATTFFPAVAEARREKLFVPRVEVISELCRRKGASSKVIVDVGAGYGIFLEEWRKRHPQTVVRAIEPSAELATVCRTKGIEVAETIVEDADTWLGCADLVTCFEVIEHVHDPLLFVQALRRLVRPGGYLLISGLSVDGFDIQILWERSKSVSPPHHINFMSLRGFEQLFQRAGIQEIQVTSPGKLDCDIVINSMKEDPCVDPGRFFRTMASRGQSTLEDFQEFLARNRLSSHFWVWGIRPGD